MVNGKEKQKLRQMTVEALNNEISDLTLDAATKRSELALGKLSDVKVIKKIKKRIAVIKTIIREKELASNTEASE